MSRFFINRPIVAMVIAILTVFIGALSISGLPVSQFPNIVPPEAKIQATFVGADAQTLAAIEDAGQVVLRYAPGQNFNGSLHDIAGVRNERGNVFGLMPHPEHAVDELIGGSCDGLKIFESMRSAIEAAALA